MRKSIVFKLFLLTAALCATIIVGIFVGQTVFLKQFYVHRKVNNVRSALQTADQQDWTDAGDARTAFDYERQFHEDHNTWIALLDSTGSLKHADDFTMEIQLETSPSAPSLSGKTVAIPLYAVMNVEDITGGSNFSSNRLIEPGNRIAIEGLFVGDMLYPQRIGRSVSNLREENRLENSALIAKEYEVVPRFQSPTEYHAQHPTVLVHGTVARVQTPEGAIVSRYTNRLFWERVKAFQADLLYGDVGDEANFVIDYEDNDIPYKIFVERVTNEVGNTNYLFAMTSLQPVNEAVGIIGHYYVYIFAGALLLVLLLSFYYSRGIAGPLLRMNEATQKMTDLDFSVRIPVVTEDEIGNLSRNINKLSGLLHTHIVRLEQDVEREKRLEQTRKEFIAGVSHELKTPLSVIESGLHIVRDKPDSQRRDYYLSAMEDEVARMNLLITDMLALAKYESGTYNSEMSSFRIDDVLERVCAKLHAKFDAKGVRLHCDLLPVELIGNPPRIEQVAVNLLTNAVRNTPEGGAVVVKTTDEGDAVTVSVANTGSHIPDDDIQKVWDRFYRVEHSRNRATGGTGLGLAISKQILDLHEATYGAANTADGVRFYFQLHKKKAA